MVQRIIRRKYNLRSTTLDPIVILPVEIIDIIMDCCDVNTILSLSEVNKTWNNYISTSSQIMDKIILKISDKNYKEVSTCKRKYVNIEFLFFTPLRRKVANSILQKFSSSLRSLAIVSNCHFDYLPNVRELTIFNKLLMIETPRERPSYDMNDFFVDTRSIRIVNMLNSKNAVEILSNYGPQLEILNIACNFHDPMQYAKLNLQNLKEFRIFVGMNSKKTYLLNRENYNVDSNDFLEFYTEFKNYSLNLLRARRAI